MINFNTYKAILENPIDRDKLLGYNFDFTIYDNYAMSFALKNFDCDLLKMFKKSDLEEINDFKLFSILMNKGYSEEIKEIFKENIKRMVDNSEFHVWFRNSKMYLKENFDIFSKYFGDYIDFNLKNVLHLFTNEFFNIKSYYIGSEESLKLFKKMCKRNNFVFNHSQSSFKNSIIIQEYFGNKDFFANIEGKIDIEYVDDLLHFFIKNSELDGRSSVVNNFIEWAKKGFLLKESICAILEIKTLNFIQIKTLVKELSVQLESETCEEFSMSNDVLLKYLLISKYSEEKKLKFKNQIKQMANGSYLISIINSLRRISDFNYFTNFSKYFLEYSDDFSYKFTNGFFEDREKYPKISSKESLECFKKICLLSKYKIYDYTEIPNRYFNDPIIENCYKNVSRKYIEELIEFFADNGFLERCPESIISWAKTSYLSKNTAFKILNLEFLPEEDFNELQEILYSRKLD